MVMSAQRLSLVKSFILLYSLVMNQKAATKVILLGSIAPDEWHTLLAR